MTTQTKQRDEATTAKPKVWRNLWRIPIAGQDAEDGTLHEAGQKVWGFYTWPSEDAAFRDAAEEMMDDIPRGCVVLDWLGAYEVEE